MGVAYVRSKLELMTWEIFVSFVSCMHSSFSSILQPLKHILHYPLPSKASCSSIVEQAFRFKTLLLDLSSSPRRAPHNRLNMPSLAQKMILLHHRHSRIQLPRFQLPACLSSVSAHMIINIKPSKLPGSMIDIAINSRRVSS